MLEYIGRVVSQKLRPAEIDVTLGLVLTVSQLNDQIVKRGRVST